MDRAFKIIAEINREYIGGLGARTVPIKKAYVETDADGLYRVYVNVGSTGRRVMTHKFETRLPALVLCEIVKGAGSIDPAKWETLDPGSI